MIMFGRRGMWVGMIVLWVMGVMLARPTAVSACVGMGGQPEDRFRYADAVFVGTALESTTPPSDFYHVVYDIFAFLPFELVEDPYLYEIEFEIAQAWKGSVSSAMTIKTDGYCGAPFEAGKAYIVFAHETADGGLHAGNCCAMTREVSYAGNDLTYLSDRPLVAIAPAPLLSVVEWVGLGVLGLLVASGIGGVIWARKHRVKEKQRGD